MRPVHRAGLGTVQAMEGAGGPRITPGNRSQIGWVNAAIVRLLGLATGGRAPNVFTTLARHHGLFRRWLWFAGGLMPGGKLPRAETELAILRVAHNTGCEYEWAHHGRLGKRADIRVGHWAQRKFPPLYDLATRALNDRLTAVARRG
jgi:AhpD family alkylhydroperoxidase